MSGMIEPDDTVKLLELIMSKGFLTDPNLVGTEKMAVTFAVHPTLPRRVREGMEESSHAADHFAGHSRTWLGR